MPVPHGQLSGKKWCGILGVFASSRGERMHLIHADRTNASTAVTVAVARVGNARIEVEVATESGIARVERRRPEDAVRAPDAELSAAPVACAGQEYGLACITSCVACERSAFNAVDRCPCVGCISQQTCRLVELGISRHAPGTAQFSYGGIVGRLKLCLVVGSCAFATPIGRLISRNVL